MRVLVTGGAGFIGSNVVKILEEKGIEATILDNFSHASYKNILDVSADIICGDITDETLYEKLPKLDAIIHEAAITDTTLVDDTKMMMVNYTGAQNVLNFCLKKNIPLVYASSAGVYGASQASMREDQALTPHNTYGYSKYIFDSHVRKTIAKKDVPHIVGLRYFNVYGPREYHKEKAASMVYQLYLQMKEDKNPRIFEHGQQQRDFVYVKDVARITVDALFAKKSFILNVGTGTPRSFNDMVSILNKVLQKELEPDYFENPYSGLYQNFTQADVTLLKKVLNTKADFSLEQGIADYLKNHLLGVEFP